jgi:hypothetical protein
MYKEQNQRATSNSLKQSYLKHGNRKESKGGEGWMGNRGREVGVKRE